MFKNQFCRGAAIWCRGLGEGMTVMYYVAVPLKQQCWTVDKVHIVPLYECNH